VGCATPRLGIPLVYIELKLSPLYHLEEGIKEESRNRYFLYDVVMPQGSEHDVTYV